MKTKEELTLLKQEYESVKDKLQELSDEEFANVTGGVTFKEQKQGQQKYEFDVYGDPDTEVKNKDFKPGF